MSLTSSERHAKARKFDVILSYWKIFGYNLNLITTSNTKEPDQWHWMCEFSSIAYLVDI